jgi:hypothetical protein
MRTSGLEVGSPPCRVAASAPLLPRLSTARRTQGSTARYSGIWSAVLLDRFPIARRRPSKAAQQRRSPKWGGSERSDMWKQRRLARRPERRRAAALKRNCTSKRLPTIGTFRAGSSNRWKPRQSAGAWSNCHPDDRSGADCYATSRGRMGNRIRRAMRMQSWSSNVSRSSGQTTERQAGPKFLSSR